MRREARLGKDIGRRDLENVLTGKTRKSTDGQGLEKHRRARPGKCAGRRAGEMRWLTEPGKCAENS